jgi:hypothetical protein
MTPAVGCMARALRKLSGGGFSLCMCAQLACGIAGVAVAMYSHANNY